MHPNVADLKAVVSSGLFGPLSHEEIEELRSYSSVVNYHSGATIFEKGAPGDAMFAIVFGRVDIQTIWADGREIKLNMLGAGDVFGEIAALDGLERTASAVTAEATRLVRIDRDAIFGLLGEKPERWSWMMLLLCKRIRWTSNRIEATVFLDIPHRLARQIILLAESYGNSTAEGLLIGSKFTQDELARMLGVTRESVNKSLRQLSKMKMIRHQKGHIVVLDLERLVTLAEDPDI